MELKPQHPKFEERVRDSFNRQTFMHTIGATLKTVEPGAVTVHAPYSRELCQQHAFLHGGLVGTLADVAGGYATISLLPPEESALTVEYKINFLAPANGDLLIAYGRVVRPGKRVSVVQSDVYSVQDKKEKLCATMLGTFITYPSSVEK